MVGAPGIGALTPPVGWGAPGMAGAPAEGDAPGMGAGPVIGGGIGGGFCPTVPRQMTLTAMRIATAASTAACQGFRRFILQRSPLPGQLTSGVPTHGLTQAAGQW